MISNLLLSKIFLNSVRSAQNWRKENRPIVNLLDEYFTDSDIEEFIENEHITRFSYNYTIDYIIADYLDQFYKIFNTNSHLLNLFLDFIQDVYIDHIVAFECREDFKSIKHNHYFTTYLINNNINGLDEFDEFDEFRIRQMLENEHFVRIIVDMYSSKFHYATQILQLDDTIYHFYINLHKKLQNPHDIPLNSRNAQLLKS